MVFQTAAFAQEEVKYKALKVFHIREFSKLFVINGIHESNDTVTISVEKSYWIPMSNCRSERCIIRNS